MYGSWIYVEIKFCGLGRTRQSIFGIWHIKLDMKGTEKVTKMTHGKLIPRSTVSTGLSEDGWSDFTRLTRDQFVYRGAWGVGRLIWKCGV